MKSLIIKGFVKNTLFSTLILLLYHKGSGNILSCENPQILISSKIYESVSFQKGLDVTFILRVI